MSFKSKNKNIDIRFIAVIAAAVALLFAVSSVTASKNNDYEYAETPQSLESSVAELVINEIVTSNSGVYSDEDGVVSDYLELFNGTDEDINLSGYGLSDTNGALKFTFDDITIEVGSYLVISLSGKSGVNAVSASFRLSSEGGENVILTNASKRIIDSVYTPYMEGGQCLARNQIGQWYISDVCTPGYENSLDGREEYLESLLVDSDISCDLAINELLPQNKGNLYSSDEGFVEFINCSDETINLSDYFISDDWDIPFKKQLPDVLLKSGELYVMYFGGNGSGSSAGFSCDSEPGELLLCRVNKVADCVSYASLAEGFAMERGESGYYLSCTVSPGYENTADGIALYQKENEIKTPSLSINEVMTSNTKVLCVNEKYYDWVEIYNNSDNAINLSGYYLATSENDLTRYALPDTVLKAGEYFVILCSGDEDLSQYGYYCTDFKLKDEQTLIVSDGRSVLDKVFVGMVPSNWSFGKSLDYGFVYMSEPTPGKENSEGVRCVSSEPSIYPEAGVYETGAVSVEISGEGEIHYTLDGSDPTADSPLYTKPITLTATTVLKAAAISDGAAVSGTITATYIINEGHNLPVVSLSLDPDVFSSTGGRSTNVMSGYVEFFDGEDGFSQSCGIGYYGGSSRSYSRKNFAIRFGSKYGTENLVYKLFDDRDTTVYDSFGLRGGSQDMEYAIFRNDICCALVDDYCDVDTLAVRPVILYINGKYWGLYTMQEKKNVSMLENHYNTKLDTVNMMASAGWGLEGDYTEYYQLISYIKSHDLSVDEYYDYVCTKVDVQNFADFFIAQLYVANVDFYNIIYFQNDNIADGKWRCLFYDLDYSFSKVSKNSYNDFTSSIGFGSWWMDGAGEKHYISDNVIIRNLLRNKKFQELWLERLNYHLTYTWNKQRVLDEIEKWEEAYSTEIVRNQKRWGFSVSTWRSEVQEMKNFAQNRQDYVLKYTQSKFGLTDDQMKQYFGELYN